MCIEKRNVKLLAVRSLTSGLAENIITPKEYLSWIDVLLTPNATESIVIPDIVNSIKAYAGAIVQVHDEHGPDLSPAHKSLVMEMALRIAQYNGRLQSLLEVWGG